MISVNFLDSIGSYGSGNDKRPLLSPEILKDDKKLLEWLNAEFEHREGVNAGFLRDCERHLRAYKGEFFKTPSVQSDSNEFYPVSTFTSKYFVNKIYSNVEHLVSKMNRLKPGVDVVPASDEYADKLATRDVEFLCKHLENVNNVDQALIKAHRNRIIFGEAFIHVFFNKELGDLHPNYIELRDSGNLDLIKEAVGSDAPIRIGEVALKHIMPWNLFADPKKTFEESDDFFIREYIHEDKLRLKYKDYKPRKPDEKMSNRFNIESGKGEPTSDAVLLDYYHNKDDQFPEGVHIKFTATCILEKSVLKCGQRREPVLRISDIDAPDRARGMSRLTQVLSIQNAHNNLSQMSLKNEFLVGSPKWMFPRGAVKANKLADNRTILEYTGPIAPQLVQMNPTNANTYNLRDRMSVEIDSEMGIHQISTGQPPTGITAAVALQFLNEQEIERSSSDITKHNLATVELYRLMVGVAGDNYQPEDGRIVRIFGKNNKHVVHYLEVGNLSKNYDFRIQNGTALPQSKSARMERILQTMQYGQALLPPERWIELLEFGSVEKMQTILTEAIATAESEIEDIMNGVKVDEPKEWEDHVTKLHVFYKRLQSRSFKEDTPAPIRAEVIEHIKISEMLANEKALKNPTFAARLSQLDLYPMFMTELTPPPSAEQQNAVVQGQANRGDPISGQLPAQPLR